MPDFPDAQPEIFYSIIVGTTRLSTESTATPGSTSVPETSLSQSSVASGTVSGQTTVTSGSGSTQVAVETASSSSPSSLSTSLGSTTAALEATTTIECTEMQAVDEAVSKLITVTPNELPQGANVDFQPTSKQGVSFPNDDTTPTITVHFAKPAQVRSVTIPRDTTQNANVQQFEVTFYSPQGKKVNNQPILSNSSPQDDKYLPAGLDASQIPSNTPVSRLDITVLKTTDNQSPKGVVLDIQACTQAGAGKCFHFGTTDWILSKIFVTFGTFYLKSGVLEYNLTVLVNILVLLVRTYLPVLTNDLVKCRYFNCKTYFNYLLIYPYASVFYVRKNIHIIFLAC